MTTARDFMETICRSPDDDTLRGVFSDWLEENGQSERAEFCRVQCELAKPCTACSGEGEYDADHRPGKMECRLCFGQKTLYGPRADELRRRERELLKDHWNEWTPDGFIAVGADNFVMQEGGYEDLGDDPLTVKFARGFIDAITCRWEDWIGGACRECYGTGTYLGMPLASNPGVCNVCHGTRLTPGIERLLCWHPKYSRDVCPDCGGTGMHRKEPWGCAHCVGLGAVPRPFPATAQPVRRVVLDGP